MAGRPRKPTKILKFTGAFDKNPQRADARRNEPKPSGEIGDAPDRLTEEQADVWREIVAVSLPGVLSNAERVILEELVCAITARRDITARTGGIAYDVKLGGFIKACCEQLGITPAARSKVQGMSADKPKENSFAAI